MANKYTIKTDNLIMVNEKPINAGNVLSDVVSLSPQSEINISNVRFGIQGTVISTGGMESTGGDYSEWNTYADSKYKCIPKIQFIKNGQRSGWATLIDASENIIPYNTKYHSYMTKYNQGSEVWPFAKFVKVDADPSTFFNKQGDRKRPIDYGTSYSHPPLEQIDYPGVLHFTPEFGSQELRNLTESPENYKLVKRILTKDTSLDHKKLRLSINAMNWITYADKTSSNDFAYKKQDFIEFRLKFGIYKFNKTTGEYNDESNEVYSTDYKKDPNMLKNTVFRIYLSPDIINNDSFQYVKNIFGKNLSGDVYDGTSDYYRSSFVWNTSKNPLSGKIKFDDTSETYNLLKDYTHYDGSDYGGYYARGATSFTRKVLNKYRFKVLSTTDLSLFNDKDIREFANEFRFTSPEYVYNGGNPSTINLKEFRNSDLLITSAVGYEILEFNTVGRHVGETYYYPYSAKNWPGDNEYPYGYYNAKGFREQKLYHYISPSVDGKIEFYTKSGDVEKDLTKKDNRECIAYNSIVGFKFKRNIGRWNNSLNDGDKYIVQLKFTYRLEGEKSDTTFTYNVSDKIFKGSTNIYAGDAEKPTEQTSFDLPQFSQMFPNVFGQQDYVDVKIEAYYTHCYGNNAYGYTNKISNYTTETTKIFTTKLRVYQHLAITEETPEYVFYDSFNNICESVFESSENMEVDFNTFNKLNCVSVKNINTVLASYVPSYNIEDIAFNTLITKSSNSPTWVNFIRPSSSPVQPPLQYFYYSNDTYWNKNATISSGYGNVIWSTKSSTGSLTDVTIESKGITCRQVSDSQIDINLGSMTSYLASIKVTGKRSNGQTITLNALFRNNSQKPNKFKTEDTPYDESFNFNPLGLVDTVFDESSVNPDNSKYLDIAFGILDYNNHQFTDDYYILFDLQQETDVEHFGDLSFILKSTNMIDIYPPIQATQFFNSVTFVLETSVDGTTWTQQDTKTITTSNMYSTTMSFDSVTCRYVKLSVSNISFNTSYNPENIDMGVIQLDCDVSITTENYNVPQANIEVYEDFSKTSKIAEINYNDLDNVTDVGSQLFSTTSDELYIFNKEDGVLLNENNFKLIPITNLDIYNSRNYTKTWSEPANGGNGYYDDYIYTGCVCNYDVKILNTNYNKPVVPIYKFTLQASEIKTPNNSNADEHTSSYNRFYFYYDSNSSSNVLPKILRNHLSDPNKFDIINCAYGDVTSIPLTPYTDDTKENTVTILLCELDSMDDKTAENILVWSDTNCNSILFDKTNIESGQVSFVLGINQGDIIPQDFRIVSKNLISTNLDKNFVCEKLTTEGHPIPAGVELAGLESTSKTNIYRIKADTTYYFPDIGAILDQVSQSSIGDFSVELKFYTKEGVSDSTWTNIIYRNTSTPISRTYIKSPSHNSLTDINDNIVGDPYYMTITFSTNEAAYALEDYFYISEEPSISRRVNGIDFRMENIDTNLYKYTWDIPQHILDSYVSNVDYNIKFLPVNLGEKDNLTATGRDFIVKGSSQQYSMNLKYIPDTGISRYYEGNFPDTYNGKRIDGSRTWTQSTPTSLSSNNYSAYKFNLLQQVLYLNDTIGNPGGTYEQIYCVQPNTWYVVCNAESVAFYNYISKRPDANKQLYVYGYEYYAFSNTTTYVSGATSLSGNTSKHPMLVYSGNNGCFMVVKTSGTKYDDSGIQVYYETNSGYNYKLNVWDIGASSSDATRAITVDKGVKHIGYVTNGQIWVHRNAWQGRYYTEPISENEEYYLNLTKNTSYSLLVIYKSSNSTRYVHLTKSYEYITLTTELRTGLPEYNSFRFISSLEDMYIKYPKLTVDDVNDFDNILNVFNDSNTSMIINSPYDDDINTYIQTIRPGIYTHSHESGQDDPYNPDYTYKYFDVPKLVHPTQGYDDIQWRSMSTQDYHYVIGGGGVSNVPSCQNILIYNNNLNSYGLDVDLYDGYGNKVNDDPIEIPNTETSKRIKLDTYNSDIYEIDVKEKSTSGHLNISYILYNDYVLDSLDVKKFDESDSTFIYNYDSSRKQLNYKFNTDLVPITNSTVSIYYSLQFKWYKKLFINSLGKSFISPYTNYIDLNLNRVNQNYISKQSQKFFADSNMDDIYERHPNFIPGENYIKYKQYFDAYGVSDFSIQNGKQSVYTIDYPKKRVQYDILPLSFYDDLFSILGVVNYKINYYIKNGLMKISRLPNEVGDVIESIFILADFRSSFIIYSGNLKIYKYDKYGNKELADIDYLRDDVIYRMSWFGEDCCYVEIVLLENTYVTINQLLRGIYILPETYQEHNCSVLRIPTSNNYYWYNENLVDLNNYSNIMSENEMLIQPIVHSPTVTDESVEILSSNDSRSWSADNISDTINYTFNEDKIINTIQINVRKKSNYFIQVQYKNSEQNNYTYLTDSDGNIITFDDFNKDCLNIKTFNFNDIKANDIVITFTYENKYVTDDNISDDKYCYIGFSDNSYNELGFVNSANSTYIDWGCVPGTFTSKLKSDAIWTTEGYYKTFTINGNTHKLFTNLIHNNYINTITYDSTNDSINILFTRDVKEITALTENIEIHTSESNETISGGGTKKTLIYSISINNVTDMMKYDYFVFPISVIRYTDFEHSDNTNVNKYYLYFNFTNIPHKPLNDIYPIYSALDANWVSASIYKNNNNLKCVDLNSSTTRFSLVSADPSEIYGPDFNKEIYIIFENEVGKSWSQPSDTGIGYTYVYKFNYLDIDTNIFEDISMIKAGGSNVVKIKLSQTKSKKVNSFKIKDNTGLMHNIVIYDRNANEEEPSHISSINWNSNTGNVKTSVNYVSEDIFKVHFPNVLIDTYTINVSNGLSIVGDDELKYTLHILFDSNATIQSASKGIINQEGHRLSLVVDSDLSDKETRIKIQINGTINYIDVLNANSYAILSEVEQSVTNNPTNVYRYDISSINDTSRVKVGNANIEFGNNGIGVWEKTTSDTSSNDYPLKYRFYLTDSNTHAVNSIQKAKTMYVELDNFTEKSGYNFSTSNAYWNSRTLQISKLDKELMTYNVDDEYVFPQKGLLNQRQITSLTLIPYGSTMEFIEYVNSEGASVLINTYEFETGGFDRVDDILKLKLNFLSNYTVTNDEFYEESLNINVDVLVNFYDSSDKNGLIFTELNTLSLSDTLPHEFSFSYIDMTQVKYVEFIFTLSNWEFTKTLDSDETISYIGFEMAYGLYLQTTQQLNNTYIINHNTDLYDTMTNEDESDNLTIVNESDNHPDSDYVDDRKYRDFSGDIIHIMRDED